MDELTPEQKFALEPSETAIHQALLMGKPREKVIADLLRFDYTPHGAMVAVARAEEDLRRLRASPQSRAALLKEASDQILAGVLIALLGAGGLALSVIGMFATGYVSGWVLGGGCGVAVLLGFIFLSRGFRRRALFRSLEIPFETPAKDGTQEGTA